MNGTVATRRERVSEGVSGADLRLLGYMPKQFMICPLPVRSTPAEVKEYEKKYNNFRLRLVGADGVPGGKIARDMLVLFATEAVYKGAYRSHDDVGLHFNSITQFAKSIGIERNNYNKKIISLLKQFLGCNLYFEGEKKEGAQKTIGNGEFDFDAESGDKLEWKRMVNVPFISRVDRIDLIKGGAKSGEPVAIDIYLSPQFVDMVCYPKSAVPVDFSVYREIQSTLEADLYVWLVYKNKCKIGSDGAFISRKNLIEQFGEENEGAERMKYVRILEAVGKIKKEYYPELDYKVIDKGSSHDKGIVLFKSEVPVGESDTRYVPLLSV